MITVFYHLYIPPGDDCFTFPLILDEQLGLIERSLLGKHAKIKMCITMPKNQWLPLMCRNYVHLVTEYISGHFPNVEIIDIRDVSEPNLYEGQTLYALWRYSHLYEGNYLYLHSKGISHRNIASTHDWRKCMQYFLVGKWETCLAYLKSHDVVATKSHWLGNFWWATSDHLRRLPDPLSLAGDSTDPNVRLVYESWVLHANPKIHYMHETKVNHYLEFYPPSAYET